MFFGLSTAAISLILVGSLGVSIAHAVMRRDPAWVLALGLPLLLCVDLAGLPSALVAWGCVLYAAAVCAFVLLLIVRTLGLAGGLGLIVAASVLGLSAGTANARYVDLASSSLHHPPLIGVRLEAWLRLLADA